MSKIPEMPKLHHMVALENYAKDTKRGVDRIGLDDTMR